MSGMQVVNKGQGKSFEFINQQLRTLRAKYDAQTKTWNIPAEMLGIAQTYPSWGKGLCPVESATSRPSHADLSHDADALYEDGIDDPRFWTKR